MYTFYAFMNRMKLIQRWNLMRSNIREDLMQHTGAVAIFGQALGIIRNTVYGGNVDVDKIAALALYHDTAEVVSGDLPTPVKYYNESMEGAYKEIESVINKRLIDSLPDELKEAYTPYIMPNQDSVEYKLMKIADKLSAFVKCSEERLLGNREFDNAYNRLKSNLDGMRGEYPELGYFMDNFMDGFSASVDIL